MPCFPVTVRGTLLSFHLIICSLCSAKHTPGKFATIIIVMSRFARATAYDASRRKSLRVVFHYTSEFPVLYWAFIALVQSREGIRVEFGPGARWNLGLVLVRLLEVSVSSLVIKSRNFQIGILSDARRLQARAPAFRFLSV